MARYSVCTRLDNIVAAGSLIHIQANSGRPVTLIKAEVTNGSNTTNDQLEVQLSRTTGTAAGGATLAPVSRDFSQVAATATVRSGAVTGTTADGAIERAAFPSLGGWGSGFSPEEYPRVGSGAGFMLELLDTPASSINLTISLTWEE